MASVTNVTIALQSGTTNTLYCTWKSSLSHVDHFEVQWNYATGDGYAFDGGTVSVSSDVGKQSGYNPYVATYDYPSNATHVRAFVKPVSTTRTVNGEEVSYWEGTWTQCEEDYYISQGRPETPDTPSLEIGGDANSSNQYKLTMTLSDIRDSLTDYVEFYIRKNGKSKVTTVFAKKNGSFGCIGYYYVSPGATYAVAARAINDLGSGTKSTITLVDGSSVTLYSPIKSDWSPYSSEVSPPPDAPTDVDCCAYEETVAKVTWTKATGATGYEIQYSKDRSYLETSSNDVNSQTVDTDVNTAYVTGLDSGEEWFFRVRATNDAGSSSWSDIVSTVIGTVPEAPTTWSSTTTAMIGETITLYWVHNCEDGSDQTAAQIQIKPSSGSTSEEKTIDIEGDDNSYIINAEDYNDGDKLSWCVRTAGITGEYSEWSTTRIIKIYSAATVSLEMGSTMDSFPFNIIAEAGPSSQKAISYYISVFATDSYEVLGPTGETTRVSAGDEIYSKLYNVSLSTLPDVVITLSVGDLTLQDGQAYTVVVTVTMDSGLSAEASAEFTVKWSGELYSPSASVGIDSVSLVSYVAPYCERLVDYEDGDDPDTAERELVSGVTLAVYRREADGKFTLIGDDIANTGAGTVTDPHPALDYARYRIVATETSTGRISFEDLPGVPIKSPYVVIQWDEDWTDFNYDGPDKMFEPAWAGSMVKIPYDVDVSESHSPDASLVEYVGREHPVGYYGTQLGETASWSVDVPKNDEDTIYALRRLAVYMGDVYVREPSGTGYWAQVTVSMNTNHCALVVPVNFTISRVEGGM